MQSPTGGHEARQPRSMGFAWYADPPYGIRKKLCHEDHSRRAISWYLHRLPARTGCIADLSHDPVVSLELNGNGTIERGVDGRWEKASLRSDTLTLTPAFVACEWRWSGQPLDILDVYIPFELLQDAWSTHFSASAAYVNLEPRLILRDDAVVHLMKSLLSVVQSGRTTFTMVYETLTDLLMFNLLGLNCHTIRRQPDSTPGLPRLALHCIQEYIDAHLAHDLSLRVLAAVAGVSRFHFLRLFQSTVGISPHCYVTRRRMEQACRLLRTTELPVREVAALCGYEDPSYFAAQFRRYFKASPNRFRRGDG